MIEYKDYANLWVEKWRPKKLDDLILSDRLKKDILQYKKDGEIPHLLFYGKAGGGKTSLAKILVNDLLDCQYEYINASDENGIETVRGKIKNFSEKKSIDGKLKVIILDECDGLSGVGGGNGSSAQQALRNVMEEGSHNVRFILTANYVHKLIDELKSRCISYHVEPPLREYLKRCAFITQSEGIKIEDTSEFVNYTKAFYPDMRLAINSLQRDSMGGVLNLTKESGPSKVLTKILDNLATDGSPIELRKILIQNTTEFKSDYRQLLIDLFNYIFSVDIDSTLQRRAMVEIASGLYQHEIVMDKEINAYATLLRIKN